MGATLRAARLGVMPGPGVGVWVFVDLASHWQNLGSSGNQRELARQKNLKKTQEIHKGKRKEDSLSASQRKQRDSEIMQQKQKAANERKSLQAGTN
ncbi:small EDRK-rich factor 1-like isoform X1 [Corvus cornix cornix]|uniref:small EDRK-rich factor 1-like isoform X1 n=1 Tax=Corvus cornix cornix TaxID=932674 RepID=UPI0008167C0E|nr:small EDRK-rich factor 1-like isoform X1 [Corvus cornix cornix]XP_017590857.1 PREDICTED: small EDRK-rich factor 1 isoform X1 [Corvus brachyrhynchos]XP_031951185.1 small EDRK-rich factor 1-like isoform X1 [Corvus moneduloides]XP_041879488.1 small EDRK-rich factor 1-like isoform X1 [Corvus kubaryi]XP_048147150.1 small EDRK-rich factor 1-like isoform X1 [Corvus hawaiiensis]